jgi:SAM-dependent methyltransferase
MERFHLDTEEQNAESAERMASHLGRYRFAGNWANEKEVLDCGCGEGYGTNYLRLNGAKSVVGIDIDVPTVNRAISLYGEPFICANAEELPFTENRFDLVVCFENIEHVDDPQKVLREIRRVLRPNGNLLISTPRRDSWLRLEDKPRNPFHQREYNLEEFENLILSSFTNVQMFGHNFDYLLTEFTPPWMHLRRVSKTIFTFADSYLNENNFLLRSSGVCPLSSVPESSAVKIVPQYFVAVCS